MSPPPVDVTKLSDEELMQYVKGGGQFQPVDAQTGQNLSDAQGQTYVQLAAVGGLDPRAPPGSARMPLAQQRAEDTPSPGQFYVDPQGRVQQMPNSDLENISRGVFDRTRAFSRGVPVLGAFADEADAHTNAFLAPAVEPVMRGLERMGVPTPYDERYRLDNVGDYKQRFDAALNMQRFMDDRFDTERPKESLGWQIAGGVGGTVAALPALGAATAAAGPEAGVLMRMGTGAVEGAAAGGLHGYGTGTGGWTDASRLGNAGLGAGLGAAAGGALPLAAEVGGAAWKASGGRVVDALRGERQVQGPVSQEAQRLASAMRGDPPPVNAEAAAVSAQRSPLTARASDVDDAYVRIARALERSRMGPQEAADKAMSLGPFGVLADSSPSMQDLLRAAINRPGKGSGIARENLGPRQQGIFNKETGDWDVRPSSSRLTDQAAEGLGVGGKEFHSETDAILAGRKAAAAPAYAKAYEAPPADIGELRDFVGTPDFRKAYDRAREISQREFVLMPDGSKKIVPLPEQFVSNETMDWRTLDLMKQSLDDMVKEGATQGIGSNTRNSISGYRDAFRDKLDSLNPDYKAARDAYAGPTAMKDALEEGRKLLREDSYVIGQSLAAKSESERQMLRLGALQELKTKLGNANVTFDAANQAGLLKPNQLARFKELFPDQKSFADFVGAMENEKTMYGTGQAAFGNSTTAKQLLHVQEPSDPLLEGAGQAVGSVASANVMGLIQAIRRMGMESPMREGVAETIASVLTSHEPGVIGSTVARMTEAQRSAAMADALRKSMGTGAGQAASSAGQPLN